MTPDSERDSYDEERGSEKCPPCGHSVRLRKGGVGRGRGETESIRRGLYSEREE